MKPKWPAITWAYCNDKSGDGPRVLGINPWIYDFAAYNLWSRPAGLLAGLHMLRASGARVALMDCLDRTWSDIPWPKAHDTVWPCVDGGYSRQQMRCWHELLGHP